MDNLAYVDNGKDGQPGSGYDKQVARVDRIRPGRYQLSVFVVWGSNQGYLEEHGRIERRYRAGNIDELMHIGLAEVASDAELGQDEARLLAAIRAACFAAEDAESRAE